MPPDFLRLIHFGHTYRTLLEFLYGIGIRIDEAMAQNLEDVDPVLCYLAVRDLALT